MSEIFKNFYKNFYAKTNGFIPSKPLNLHVYPGDFFQIQNGEMVFLGNIFRNGLVNSENTSLTYDIMLNQSKWMIDDGITRPYTGKGTGENPIEGDFEFNKQVIAFDKRGSYIFRGKDPKGVRITNWSDLWQSLIIKLTTVQYSFRSLYVVTETATTSHWALAIADNHKGELEIANESESHGLKDFFGHADSKTIQMLNIGYSHFEDRKIPSFFKAKKLVVQDEKLNTFISDLIIDHEFRNTWASTFYDYDFFQEEGNGGISVSTNSQACILDMLQANQLNPNTALLYFRWEDANMEDIDKLFVNFGYGE